MSLAGPWVNILGLCIGITSVLHSLCTARGMFLFMNRHVVKRREPIIRWGRRAQNALRLPRALRVIADIEPGMEDLTIEFAASMAVFIGAVFMDGLGAFILYPPGWRRNKICVGMMAIYPGIMTAILWTILVLARYTLEKRLASRDKEMDNQTCSLRFVRFEFVPFDVD
ncbi:hypothetical protein QBC47DRAFT_363358 [Echria macrotheca]|uniref:Uncharacterized protein n=1 Tax=Echria macrotheca TaxID=438768 RepID=A0AAJ0B6K0_9PEZI|nr:hypothetical protein QBC47DRAFT_363358 [Echria macrotheca]